MGVHPHFRHCIAFKSLSENGSEGEKIFSPTSFLFRPLPPPALLSLSFSCPVFCFRIASRGLLLPYNILSYLFNCILFPLEPFFCNCLLQTHAPSIHVSTSFSHISSGLTHSFYNPSSISVLVFFFVYFLYLFRSKVGVRVSVFSHPFPYRFFLIPPLSPSLTHTITTRLCNCIFFCIASIVYSF